MKQSLKNWGLLFFGFSCLLIVASIQERVFAADDVNRTSNDFSFVVTSDPQYPWTDKTDQDISEPEHVKEARSLQLIREQYNSINSFADTSSDMRMTMINGDITAYGHSYQWSTMKEEMRRLKMPVTYGLGNHDIENNFNDTFLNNAWERSYRNMYDATASVPNLIARHSWRESSFFITRFIGSLSYSFHLGPFRVIQAQNYPNQSIGTSGLTQYSLIPGVEWIKEQLETAYKNNEPVLLNLHKPDGWSHKEFREMVELYYELGTLKAIFVGHHHENLGKYTSPENFGNVPLYYSGSASQRSYLINEFKENTLNIYSVRQNDWTNKELIETIVLSDEARPDYEGKTVMIRSVLDSSKVIDWSENNLHPSHIIAYNANGGKNQLWQMEKIKNTTTSYVFRSVKDLSTRIAESKQTDGSGNFFTEANTLINNQYSHWELIPAGKHEDGWIFLLKNRQSANVLDLPNGNTANETRLITYYRKNGPNQKFIIQVQ